MFDHHHNFLFDYKPTTILPRITPATHLLNATDRDSDVLSGVVEESCSPVELEVAQATSEVIPEILHVRGQAANTRVRDEKALRYVNVWLLN